MAKVVKIQKVKSQTMVLKQHNNFVETRQPFTLIEKKILIAVAWLWQNQRNTLFSDDNVLSITAKEISKIINISKGSWQLIDKSLKTLQTTLLEIRDPENRDNWDRYTFFSRSSYTDGVLQIELHPNIRKFFEDIAKNYTLFDLNSVRDLKHFSSLRLYELLKQFANVKSGKRYFKLTDLKELLGITDQYSQYKHFKYFVLKVAQKELKEKTDIRFDFEEIYHGRSVVQIVFEIHKNIPHIQKVEAVSSPMTIERLCDDLVGISAFDKYTIHDILKDSILKFEDTYILTSPNAAFIRDKLGEQIQQIIPDCEIIEKQDA